MRYVNLYISCTYVRTCMYMYVSVWLVCADTQSSLNGLTLDTSPMAVWSALVTRWQREGASWQCSHPLQVYNLKSTQQVSARARTEHNRTVVQQAHTLWTWIAIGNWCNCIHSFPPPGCRVVLYTLTLFIDDCKDYAFSLAYQQVFQQTLTVSCWGLCVAEMDEVTWL